MPESITAPEGARFIALEEAQKEGLRFACPGEPEGVSYTVDEAGNVFRHEGDEFVIGDANHFNGKSMFVLDQKSSADAQEAGA